MTALYIFLAVFTFGFLLPCLTGVIQGEMDFRRELRHRQQKLQPLKKGQVLHLTDEDRAWYDEHMGLVRALVADPLARERRILTAGQVPECITGHERFDLRTGGGGYYSCEMCHGYHFAAIREDRGLWDDPAWWV